jgi:cytoskeleton protein RodZ
MSEQGTDKRSAFDSEQGQPEQNIISPGAQLAAFREQRGWTVEQVASQLNLAPRQIVAIESDDYPALPGMPIVRGFIRAYAKLLKVDPAPMLEGLGGHTVLSSESLAPRQALSTPFSEARLPTMGQRQGTMTKWVFGFLLVLLAGVAFWASQQGGGLTASTQTLSSEVRENTGVEQGADVFAPGEAPMNTSQMEPEMASQPEAVPGPVLPTASEIPAANEALPKAAPVAPASSQESGLADANTLVFNMREESWLEVRRAKDDSIVVARLAGAGETESVPVTVPVTVVVGNAAGVDVTLRGKPVELNASTRTNVARLNLK